MGGDRNPDRTEQIKESQKPTEDPLAQARTDNVAAAFQTRRDTGTYELHELNISGLESVPGVGKDSKVHPAGDFKQTEQKTNDDGSTVTTYRGKLDDNIIPVVGHKTDVTMKETKGADGKVTEMNVHYDSGQTITIQGKPGEGGGMIAKNVTDVTITPNDDGSSVMKINPPQTDVIHGRKFDTVMLGKDGKVAYAYTGGHGNEEEAARARLMAGADQ